MAESAYPLKTLRTLALHAQGLTLSRGKEGPADQDSIKELVERLIFVQIDTLQMVHRAQYLTLWSRLGTYHTRDLDDLIFSDENRSLYEYWGHAASIISFNHFRFSLPVMRHHRENPGRWTENWLVESDSEVVIANIRQRIREEGGLRSSDFKDANHKSEPWWGWKPAKRGLEYLFTTGELLIERRENFQRVYNLAERVIPAWVDQSECSLEETREFLIENAARALGVCRPEQIAEYSYLKRGTTAKIVARLLKRGVLLRITGLVANGDEVELVIHRDNLPTLEKIAAGEIRANRTTFLNPFDNLFWAKGRDQDFWGFTQTLEAYKKARDRIWGYYSLPILHQDALIGRFDPKLERNKRRLILRSLWLEEGIKITEQLIGDVAEAMRDFMRFHDASELIIEKSHPEEFSKKLLKTL